MAGLRSLHHSRQRADSRMWRSSLTFTPPRRSPCSPAIQPVGSGTLLWSWSSRSPSQLSHQPANAKGRAGAESRTAHARRPRHPHPARSGARGREARAQRPPHRAAQAAPRAHARPPLPVPAAPERVQPPPPRTPQSPPPSPHRARAFPPPPAAARNRLGPTTATVPRAAPAAAHHSDPERSVEQGEDWGRERPAHTEPGRQHRPASTRRDSNCAHSRLPPALYIRSARPHPGTPASPPANGRARGGRSAPATTNGEAGRGGAGRAPWGAREAPPPLKETGGVRGGKGSRSRGPRCGAPLAPAAAAGAGERAPWGHRRERPCPESLHAFFSVLCRPVPLRRLASPVRSHRSKAAALPAKLLPQWSKLALCAERLRSRLTEIVPRVWDEGYYTALARTRACPGASNRARINC